MGTEIEKTEQTSSAGMQENAGEEAAESSRPKRYKIYDRIASNVSLRTIDIIIAVTAVLLIAAVIYGIATGSAV